MDKKLFSCGVFIDLKKAFDTVNHNIFLDKLNYYGFRRIINQWFCPIYEIVHKLLKLTVIHLAD